MKTKTLTTPVKNFTGVVALNILSLTGVLGKNFAKPLSCRYIFYKAFTSNYIQNKTYRTN